MKKLQQQMTDRQKTYQELKSIFDEIDNVYSNSEESAKLDGYIKKDGHHTYSTRMFKDLKPNFTSSGFQ